MPCCTYIPCFVKSCWEPDATGHEPQDVLMAHVAQVVMFLMGMLVVMPFVAVGTSNMSQEQLCVEWPTPGSDLAPFSCLLPWKRKS